MMTASLLLFLSSSLCLLLVFLPHVTGVEARGQSYDLQVQTVSRVVVREGDKEQFVVTVSFTATIQPQIRWTYSAMGERIFLNDTEMTFSGGRGQTRVTFDIDIRQVTLGIGYFDTHHLDIFIKKDSPFNITQTLNTGLSSVSPGYDITYNSGESFQVSAIIPRHIAEGFSWSHFLGDPEREYNVNLEACYVGQNPDRVLCSVDGSNDPDMSRFLQRTKNFGADGARWQLDFSTAHEGINGYFRFQSYYDHKDYRNRNASQFVMHIWETVDVKVHNSSTPGPFPDNYAYVRPGIFSKQCHRGSECIPYCRGYANNITEVAIFKEATGESPGKVYAVYENSNHVIFHTHFSPAGNVVDNYVCQIVAADGTVARTILNFHR